MSVEELEYDVLDSKIDVVHATLRRGFKKNSQKILRVESKIDNLQKSNNTRFEKVENRLDNIENSIGTLKSDVNTLKSDVNTLKSDVNTLKSDVNTLKSDVNTLKSDVNTLKSDVKNMDNKLDLLIKHLVKSENLD
jgi:chromosome segregation ATPase